LNAGADPNKKESSGKTPLQLAKEKQYTAITKLLEEKTA